MTRSTWLISQIITKIVSAWLLVIKSVTAHWKLLFPVLIGIVLASAIMSGTVIYFEALRDLALKKVLEDYKEPELNVLLKSTRGPTSYVEYNQIKEEVETEANRRLGWLMSDRYLVGKSKTLLLSLPGEEETAKKGDARTFFGFIQDLENHVNILPGGSWPSEKMHLQRDQLEVQALVPLEAATLFNAQIGERYSAILTWNDRYKEITVLISGFFVKTDPTEPIWQLEQEVLQLSAGSGLKVLPFYVSESTYLGKLGPSFRRLDTKYAWLLDIDSNRIDARNATEALNNIEALNAALASSVPEFGQSTELDRALSTYDRRLAFNRLPMLVVLVVAVIVILYFVASLASIILGNRRAEVALLRSRGANFRQVLSIFVIEGTLMALIAVMAGPPLAAWTVGLLGYTPAFSDLSAGERLAVTISGNAYLMSGLGGGLALISLIFPAIQAAGIGMIRHRQVSARPPMQNLIQKYYIDVMLLLVSILLFRQLTEQGSVLATNLMGETGLNQLLLALPGLALVASAMLVLRLFPLAMGLATRMLSSLMPVGLVLGMWQMARNPTHYARLSLLLILTAGLGIFASSFGATLEQSYVDRVLYSTGSDIRAEGVGPVIISTERFPQRYRRWTRRGQQTPTPVPTVMAKPLPALETAYEEIDGVQQVSPVLRSVGRDLSGRFGGNFSLLAVDGVSFGDVAWFRDDFAKKPIKTLIEELRQSEQPQGILLPENANSLVVRLKADRIHPTVSLTARVKESNGLHSTLKFGNLDSDGWVEMETMLNKPDRPLTLVSIRVHETGGTERDNLGIGESLRKMQEGSFLLDHIAVKDTSGRNQTVASFDDRENWSVLRASEEADSDVLLASEREPGTVLFSWSDGAALTARGIVYGPDRPPSPILASEAFAKALGYSDGESFQISIDGHRIWVEPVGSVDFFPTMAPDQRFIVIDLISLSQRANPVALEGDLVANEVWVSASEGVDNAELVQKLKAIEVYKYSTISDSTKTLEEIKVDPLVAAGWRALLFLAFGAVLVVSCIGYLVHSYFSFRAREVQFALLRTIGISSWQLVTVVWLEQTMVVAIGMGLGTWMGGRLGATIMPFLGHDDWGAEVVPPFSIEVNWGSLLTTYGLMLLVFITIGFGVVWLVHRISLNRALRLGEM